MKGKSYTFFIASSASGHMRRVRVPFYVVHALTALMVVGGMTVIAAMGSYSRMLWKAANYNSLRRDQDNLKQQYVELQTQVKDTNQRLSSLQSLAGEVAVAYGFTRFRQNPFAVADTGEPEEQFEQSVDEFSYLEHNVAMVTTPVNGLRLLPAAQFTSLGIAPTLWPVVGEITGHFGERLDPFSGEGAFHAGLDIASHYGDLIRATADGVVTVADSGHNGYGRLVVVDHGFGVSTWYGHLSAFKTQVGARVKAGDVIGLEGQSGRSTGPHLHYEVRIYNTPVNPWRYLKSINPSTVASATSARNVGD